MHYHLVTHSADLAELVDRVGDGEFVVVDTEFMRRDTYYPQAALIQLCFPADPGTAWLLDPLAVEDFTPLRQVFSDPATVKVLHSASEDLEVFQSFLGVLPVPLFDTQRAAALAGLGFSLGYRALVEAVSGLELAKGETRSDWLMRPLSDAQLEYAAADVVPLLPVFQHLREKLEQLGRLSWVLEDGATAVADAASPPAPSHLKVKSAWKLKPRQLAVLVMLCEWRDERARRLDKPRSWILADKVCLAIAQRLPANVGQLRSIADMPQAVVRKQGEAILDIVDSARALPDDELPAPLAPPLAAAQREQLKQLKREAARVAREWQVEPEALLPSKDYELMVRLANGEPVERPAYWSGWRADTLVKPLLDVVGAGC